MEYLDSGEYYNMDGDVIDGRNERIQTLSAQLEAFRKRDYSESQMRVKSPALADAWDKYQTLLSLLQEKE